MKNQIVFVLVVSIIGFSVLTAEAKENTPPNIIFILADDFGYTSLNSYGADPLLVRTPNIDRIAKNGMKFTNAYAAASVCTPTRYSFLMGRYPWRSSLKYGTLGVTSPLLPDPEKKTIADMLKDKGYNTAAIGKWHLGYGTTGKLEEFTGALKPGPADLGFDYHFGVPQNHGDKMGVFIENDRVYGIRSDKLQAYSRTYYGPQYYGFDAPQRINIETMEVLTKKTINWISLQNSNHPFFLYYAPVAVHHPITPSNYMRGMSACGPYGDFIQDLDHSVGQIIQSLEYKGLLENTIIIFTSDNGGDIPNDRPSSPEMQAVDRGLKINGDLRGDKHTIWEGGTRIPLIVSWPGMIEGGTVCEDIIAIMDIYATLAEITGNESVKAAKVASDSYSFLPAILGQDDRNPRTEIVTADMHGLQAIRVGNWKYIDDGLPDSLPEGRRKTIAMPLKPQLYNLAVDPGETNNQIDEKPEIAEKLKRKLESIRKMAH